MIDKKLIDIRESHKFDLVSLENWLSKKLDDFSGFDKVKQFVGGQSNPTFVLTLKNSKEYVLRKKPPGHLLPSAHAIEREYKVQKALENSIIPCPKMYILCEDTKIIGTSFYLMERLDGEVYEDVLIPEIKKPSLRREIYLSMTRLLANLHMVSYKSIELENLGKKDNYIRRQLDRWAKQWHLSKQRNIPEMESLIYWLSNNIPENDQTTLVHGDFRLGNLLFKKDSSKINALLDWELATLGHPLADLGYMLCPHYTPIGKRHGLIGVNLEEKNIPISDEIVDIYCETRKIKSFNPIFFIVFAMFRSAAILEGVYSRSIKGNASSPDAAEVGKESKPLAENAWLILNKNFNI